MISLVTIKARLAWCWSHRTKVIGNIGIAAGYAYCNQDKLGLVIPAQRMGFAMMLIGGCTLAIGLYNTLRTATT